MKEFKPNLFSNESLAIEDLPDKTYLCSNKLDGIRVIFKDGEMLSRSLKQIPNIQLHNKFDHIKKWSKENNTILDGELYNHKATFQEITSDVMTQDKIPSDNLYFYCFDAIFQNNTNESFIKRLAYIPNLPLLVKVAQDPVPKSEISFKMKEALANSYEGLMLRDPNSHYKYGRVTNNSQDGYKVKNYQTFDAKIIGIVQATIVREGAEKKTNELGNSVTSKKKDDRIPIPMVAGFIVDYNGVEQKVVYATNDEQKKYAWEHQDEFIGRWIEFKGMLEGSKDKVRHPVWVRMRGDRQ